MKKLLLSLSFLVFYNTYAQIPISDANFQDAINTCLSTHPIDGMCSNSQYGTMPNWDVSKVINMYGMFKSADVFDADLSNWNVGNVIDMSDMFYASSLLCL